MAETSEPEAARIMLGVVFFNPTIGQIEHSMRAASAFGSSSFIFNGPSKHPQEVATLKSVRGTNLICNVENLGIAFAINQLIDIFLVSQQHDLLLILDQDTEINIEILGTAIKVYGELSAAGAPCFALCAPLNESKSGESKNYPEQDCGEIYYDKVAMAASSGTFFTKDCIRVVGKMRAELFIDGVDQDWCLRAELANVSIFRLKGSAFRHSIGESGIRLLGRFFPLHTSPVRHYFIVRNSVYLFFFGCGAMKDRTRIFFSAVLRILPYICVSRNPLQSVAYILLGFWHGVTRKLGQLP